MACDCGIVDDIFKRAGGSCGQRDQALQSVNVSSHECGKRVSAVQTGGRVDFNPETEGVSV